jgi:hypothetical protein
MDSAIELLNTKYKDWTFVGCEKVQSLFSGIVHENHSGNFLLFKMQKDDVVESFLLCQGKKDDKDHFLHIILHEDKNNFIFNSNVHSMNDDNDDEKDLINEACTKYMCDFFSNDEDDEENQNSSSSSSSFSSSSYTSE